MTITRWFPSVAPVTTITIAVLLATSLAGLSTVFSLSGPWLGVVFDRSYGGSGVRVDRVMANSPATGKLSDGDIIRAFVTKPQGRVEVLSVATLEDPDQLASYSEFNAFFAHQQALWEAISSPTFTVILSDAREIELTPATYPGPAVLPVAFWWLLLFGGTSFLLGVSVWDLHDDVAARLLSLLHQTREPTISKVASNALRGLRDVVYLLGAEEAPLADVMSDIEAGAREQLAGLGVHFNWRAPERWPDAILNSQQHINLRRVVRESIANALKHANPASIMIEAGMRMNELCLRIRHDGANSDPSSWVPGRGLNNIKSRVEEMGGSHKWVIELESTNRQYCCLNVCIPLL